MPELVALDLPAGPGFVEGPPELIDEMVRAVTDRPTPYFAILDQFRAVAAWHDASRCRGHCHGRV